MSSTADLRPEVSTYLAAVRETLQDLPAAERDDLLAEVESSLLEAADEGGVIAARLGPPDEFAAELRAAAGLAAPERMRTPRRELRADAVRILRSAGGSRALRELAPIWWVARAYVAMAFIGAAWAGWSVSHPAVPSLPDGKGGLAAILAAVVVSIWLGRRLRSARSRVRGAAIAANVLLLAAALPVLQHLARNNEPQQIVYAYAPVSAPAGLTYDGAPVTNIYPYTSDGILLHDVLLFDGAGRPIDIGGSTLDPNRRYLRTAKRYAPVLNDYPIRYYDPGTTRVSHPDAAPPVHIPRLAPAP